MIEEIICAKCGKVMTRENAKIHPEYFLHDDCLPDELKQKSQVELMNPIERLIENARVRGMVVIADSAEKDWNEIKRLLKDEQLTMMAKAISFIEIRNIVFGKGN